MKKAGKIFLWILGIMAWYTLAEPFIYAELDHGGSKALYLILIITGICLAIYLWKNSSRKTLEKENEELKAENQKLRQELEAQKVVSNVIAKTENREER